ncbi:MAG: hypothetical protein ACLPX9_15645 [Rhodomicrobium sp.]
MKSPIRAAILAGTLALLTAAATLTAWGQAQMPVSLFKVVTVKDEVIIGLNAHEIKALGGPEKAPAGAIASALASKKELTVWQYAVRHGTDGNLEVAPLHPIGLLAHDSLRVEPYSSPLAVLPHG